LAAELGVSRTTVDQAFSELHAEGYLIKKGGSGTFVADPLPEVFLSAGDASGSPQVGHETHLSDRVKSLPDQRVAREFDFGPTGVAPGGVSGVNDSYIGFLLPGPRRSCQSGGSMGAEEPIVYPVSESSVITG